jgi:DNA polymerase III subunit epsilon
MFILGVDLETTSADNDAQITEIGMMLMMWKDGKFHLVDSINALMDGQTKSKPEAVEITGITDDMRSQFGYHPTDTDFLNQVYELMEQADYFVAHNGLDFDKPKLYNLLDEVGYKMNEIKAPWLDTMYDIPYPKTMTSKSLTFIAAYHGIINLYPHRAYFDVATMFKVLSNYNIDEILPRAYSPFVVIKADVSYYDRDLARKAGYLWSADPYKVWAKRVRECDLEKETTTSEEAGFTFRRVDREWSEIFRPS